MRYALAILILAALVLVVVILVLQNSSENNDVTPNQSTTMTDTTFSLSSPAFENGGEIPQEYTCDGSGIHPPLLISNTPENTTTFVLIVEDPDVPQEIREDQMFDHWVHFNIPPTIEAITAGEELEGTGGVNTAGGTEYVPPCPPTEYEPTEHRYIFTLYALDTKLDLPEGTTKQEIEEAMEDHIIQQTQLIGRYDRA